MQQYNTIKVKHPDASEGKSEQIDKLLQNFSPNEVLVSKNHKKDFQEIFGSGFHTFFLEDWIFQEDYGQERLNTHFTKMRSPYYR